MNKNKICMIFDMDGTLWDATRGVSEAYNEYLYREKGWKDYLTHQDIISITGLEIEEIADRLFPQLDAQERLDITRRCMAYENEYLSRHGGKRSVFYRCPMAVPCIRRSRKRWHSWRRNIR